MRAAVIRAVIGIGRGVVVVVAVIHVIVAARMVVAVIVHMVVVAAVVEIFRLLTDADALRHVIAGARARHFLLLDLAGGAVVDHFDLGAVRVVTLGLDLGRADLDLDIGEAIGLQIGSDTVRGHFSLCHMRRDRESRQRGEGGFHFHLLSPPEQLSAAGCDVGAKGRRTTPAGPLPIGLWRSNKPQVVRRKPEFMRPCRSRDASRPRKCPYHRARTCSSR